MSGRGGAGTAWNVVAGRSRPKYRGRGGHQSGHSRTETKPASKRQRVSDASAGSASGAGKGAGSGASKTSLLPIEKFRELNVDDKLDRIFVCVQNVLLTNERLLKAEKTVNELRNTTQVNKDRINMLAYKSIDSEARQRRNNLVFWGIPESVSEDCSVVLNDFLATQLHLDPDNIYVQRVHRIGKLKPLQRRGSGPARPRHRPLIAAFRDYPDVELILSNVDKLQGSNFGINRDYPQEIVNARKPLFKEKKELKNQFPSAKISIQFPAKLIKDGHVIRDMFPNWHKVLKLDRLSQLEYSINNPEETVFDNETTESNDSDMELETDTLPPPPPRAPRSPTTTRDISSPNPFSHLRGFSADRSESERDSLNRADDATKERGSRSNSPARERPDDSQA